MAIEIFDHIRKKTNEKRKKQKSRQATGQARLATGQAGRHKVPIKEKFKKTAGKNLHEFGCVVNNE